ncbi:choice-of-anchor A family protein [bacterium]|nr:MAG: choice-of-anchor A family protein [bacterium]
MNIKLILPILSLALPIVAQAQSFGSAAGYNVFVSGSYSSENSDIEGKLAAGGNVNLTNYSVGANLTGGTQNALVSGGVVNYHSGSVKGNIVSATAPNLSSFGYTNGGTSVVGASAVSSAINFTQTAAYLQSASTQWGALSSVGTVVSQYGGITFTGTSSTLNVFNLTASEFAAGSYYNFNIPAGATTLFNITGSTVNFHNTGYGIDPTKTVWNLVDATNVGVTSLKGSILAPKAAINGTYGAVDGQVFASSFSGNTQINSYYFNGTGLPPVTNAVPEPASMLALGLGGLALVRRRRGAKK